MVGAVPAILRDPLRFLERTVERYGDLVAFPMPRTPVLLVNDPEGARRVLQDNHRGYGKRTVQYGALSLVTGAGLLTSDGDLWRRRRRIAQPAFHHGRLDAVAEQAAAAGTSMAPSWRRLRHAVATLDDACLGVVRRRRAAGLSAADDDVLALLLRAADADGGLEEREVRDELVTLVIAGHETVASCLTWSLLLLARHPDVQNRLAAELDPLPADRAPGWPD